MATKTVLLSGSAFFVPADFDPAGPWELGGLGAGGGGRRGNSQSGGGGGGGAYARITNADASLTVGQLLFLSLGTPGLGATIVNTDGTSGTDTWANLTGINSPPTSVATGFLAKAGAGGSATGGAGGLASASIGSLKNDGGDGGSGGNGVGRGGGGGGGAGGANGPGGDGGSSGLLGNTGGSGGGGSGGGGSGSGGANGANSTSVAGGAGGANSAGAGAGVPPAGAGSLGGGGAGADAAVTPAAGGAGGAGADWVQTSDGTPAGPGGGGGGGGNAITTNLGGNGGAGGGYGAGGAGCGGSTSGASSAGNGGNGSAGFAYFTYTVNPDSGGGSAGGASGPFTMDFSMGGGLGFSPGSVGIALGASRPPGGAFSPDQIPGLVFAIRPDEGITLNGSSIVGVAPAWNTAIGAFGSGSNAPTQASGFGPNGQNLFQFTADNDQYFSTASDVTVGACTVIWLHAPTVISANKQIFANSSLSGSFIRSNTSASDAITVMAVRTVGGANTNITMASGAQPYRNMLPLAMTYDPAADGGTVNMFVNNILGGTATAVGAGGFVFNRIGVLGAATNPLDGYMGPALIYNRVLSSQEMANILAYLVEWRGQNIYVSTSGNDSTLTPWNRATPIATLSGAANLRYIGYETIAPKGGDLFRITTQANSLKAGLSPAIRMSWDGGVWGVGKAQVWGSTAPTLSVTTGTIYDCGAFPSTPMHYVHYIPSGVIAFGPNYTLGAMQRLTEDTSTPTTPAVGKWGYAGGHVYVNAGVPLTTGDIEVTLATSLVSVVASGANWNTRNLIIAFSAKTCIGVGYNYQRVEDVECYFSAADGIDAGGAIVGNDVEGCIAAYMGSGPQGTGGSAGDGYSAHDTAVVRYSRSQAWYNDKGGFNHIGTTTTSHDQCISVGSLTFRASNGVGGDFTVTNCLAVVTADAFSDHGVMNGSTTNSAIIENNTIVSLKGTGSGINQVLGGGNITALNNIITGFAAGLTWVAGGTISADYNDYYANGINYVGTTAGPHDLALNPQFVDAASFNYALSPISPCLGAGIAIPGITVDITGATRPNPPSIGAYEVEGVETYLIELQSGLGVIELQSGLGFIELQSAP